MFAKRVMRSDTLSATHRAGTPELAGEGKDLATDGLWKKEEPHSPEGLTFPATTTMSLIDLEQSFTPAARSTADQ
jgi:hypothetical protein